MFKLGLEVKISRRGVGKDISSRKKKSLSKVMGRGKGRGLKGQASSSGGWGKRPRRRGAEAAQSQGDHHRSPGSSAGPNRGLSTGWRATEDGARGVLHQQALSLSRQEESTKYFNFSASDQKSRKEAEHRYRVRGQGISTSVPPM